MAEMGTGHGPKQIQSSVKLPPVTTSLTTQRPIWNRWQLHGWDYIFSPLAWPLDCMIGNKSTTCACLLSVEQSESYNKKQSLKKSHALRLHVYKCVNKQNFQGFIVLFPKKGLRRQIAHLSVYIGYCKQLLLHGWCLTCHDWFICTPDFSCCMDEISRMLINFSPAQTCRGNLVKCLAQGWNKRTC